MSMQAYTDASIYASFNDNQVQRRLICTLCTVRRRITAGGARGPTKASARRSLNGTIMVSDPRPSPLSRNTFVAKFCPCTPAESAAESGCTSKFCIVSATGVLANVSSAMS